MIATYHEPCTFVSKAAAPSLGPYWYCPTFGGGSVNLRVIVKHGRVVRVVVLGIQK